MTPELKAKWVADLRSGKAQQGRTQFNKGDRLFCCLGRLAEVAGLQKARWPVDTYSYLMDGEHAGTMGFTFPAMTKLGLPEQAHNQLICMNDGIGFDKPQTFDQIADWIEKQEDW